MELEISQLTINYGHLLAQIPDEAVILGQNKNWFHIKPLVTLGIFNFRHLNL
jgi:hypothetical protein